MGRWGLIPWFSKTADIKFSTNNARSEELASKASFKDPWARGQRCIIPADWFDEPNWETGRNVWWRFKRADGTPANAPHPDAARAMQDVVWEVVTQYPKTGVPQRR